LSIGVVYANDHNFAEARRLIDSKANCNQLTEWQLEAVGDYYMGQIHPGEAHEMMDKMMGGEGSASLRQMHITMARRLYCDEDISGMGMMGPGGMMQMMGYSSMMGGGWGAGQGMMYPYGYQAFVSTLYLLLLLGLVILVYLWIIKLWKTMKRRGSQR